MTTPTIGAVRGAGRVVRGLGWLLGGGRGPGLLPPGQGRQAALGTARSRWRRPPARSLIRRPEAARALPAAWAVEEPYVLAWETTTELARIDRLSTTGAPLGVLAVAFRAEE